MNFRDRAINHLSEYKRTVLRVSENGIWKRNGCRYGHILPENLMTLNLLAGYREELHAYIRNRPVAIHPDFHHLNSSQALCLNFFYPMLVEGMTGLLLDLFQCGNEVFDGGEFEKISPADGTHFDFHVWLKSGNRIYFEIKYTENGFGSAKDNAACQKRYNETYSPLLAGKIRDGVDPYQAMVRHYQLLRNIAHVDPMRNDRLIIICPKDNLKLRQEFEHVMNRIAAPVIHGRIRLLTWESVLQVLKTMLKRRSDVPERFVNHYIEFERKYLLPHG